jgi:hypothetical protein
MYHQLQMHLYQGFIRDMNATISATSQSLADSAGCYTSYQASDPVIALSVCVQAVVSNTRVLENNLYRLSHNTDFGILEDAPALIRAATITGIMIITIGIQRHIPGFLGASFPSHGGGRGHVAQGNKKHAAVAEVFSEEDRCFNICIEYLTAFQNRFVSP